MTPVRPIRLPERFYLPRLDADGREVHDAMPWDGAACYVTDGARVGVQYADGTVTWVGEMPAAGEEESFADDFAGIDLNGLVEGLRAYVQRHPILQTVWADDLAQLDSLRRHAPDAVGEGEAA